MNTSDLSVYMDVYIEETDELLLTMDEELLLLESGNMNPEVIHRLFRAAHTLKGSSSAMGFEAVARLTHEMEHLLDRIRNDRIGITSKMTALLFRCVDQLRKYRENISASEEMLPAVDLINSLKSVDGDSSSEPNSVTYKTERMSVSVKLDDHCLMKLARVHLVLRELSDQGIAASVTPDIRDFADEEFPSSFQLDCMVAEDQRSHFLTILQQMPEVSEVSLIPSEVPATPVNANDSSTKLHKHQSIRVDVTRLESLINLVGELMIDHSRLNRLSELLKKEFSGHSIVADLSSVCDHANQVMNELQEGVMKSRMLPLDHLFNRFPRMIRDLADQLGKKAKLVIDGKETELDRTVIEEIGDPLIHLLRNAIDHGIEATDERRRKGKPEEGTIRISAAQEESQVVIRISDDGKGIDPITIRDIALKKQMISEEEAHALSDQELIRLIFRPGFSTSTHVTDVSGRGVGMDIVFSHIEKISGIVDIASEKGIGTQFTIKLPLTLAIISGLLVDAGNQTYIFPMTNVIEIIRKPHDQIESINNERMLKYRDEILPVKSLNNILNLDVQHTPRKMQYIVIIGYGNKKAALIVDQLIGNQEVVVKSFGNFIGKSKDISGSTILGNGKVGFILDLKGMMSEGASAVEHLSEVTRL